MNGIDVNSKPTVIWVTAIVAVTVLCAAADGFAVGQGAETVAFAGCLAIAVIGVEDVRGVLRGGLRQASRRCRSGESCD